MKGRQEWKDREEMLGERNLDTRIGKRVSMRKRGWSQGVESALLAVQIKRHPFARRIAPAGAMPVEQSESTTIASAKSMQLAFVGARCPFCAVHLVGRRRCRRLIKR